MPQEDTKTRRALPVLMVPDILGCLFMTKAPEYHDQQSHWLAGRFSVPPRGGPPWSLVTDSLERVVAPSTSSPPQSTYEHFEANLKAMSQKITFFWMFWLKKRVEKLRREIDLGKSSPSSSAQTWCVRYREPSPPYWYPNRYPISSEGKDCENTTR